MKVLLTGATGYVGRRLWEKLEQDKTTCLRLFVRNTKKLHININAVEVFEGSTFDRESLKKALAGIDTAYYLIHSMGAGKGFDELDRISAENFRDECINAGVRRIIYLGGLGDKSTASKHLLSRIETGEILSARPDKIQTLWFRAAVIIGSGSASFEIVRHLVQKLPVIVAPWWIRTKTQPIGVSDVLDYLYKAKNVAVGGNLVIDIGSEQISFKDMLIRAANVMDLKRYLIPVPFLTPRLSSLWLIFVTPVNYRIARALIDGLKSETILQNDNAKKFFLDIVPEPYEESVKNSLNEIESSQVISRWCDSSAKEKCDIKHLDRISDAVFSYKKVYEFENISSEEVFASIQSIGGKRGWSRYGFFMFLIGLADKAFGGPGLNRGRRDPVNLRIGDGLDFCKVVDLKEGKRLLLLLQMKIPGKEWIEFNLEEKALMLTVYFLPRGLYGRIYWHISKPLHNFILSGIADKVIERSHSFSRPKKTSGKFNDMRIS
ncbi:MAG: DUF2867 domain-containing protein [Candidatus Aminicenantaceae bacterium]